MQGLPPRSPAPPPKSALAAQNATSRLSQISSSVNSAAAASAAAASASAAISASNASSASASATSAANSLLKRYLKNILLNFLYSPSSALALLSYQRAAGASNVGPSGMPGPTIPVIDNRRRMVIATGTNTAPWAWGQFTLNGLSNAIPGTAYSVGTTSGSAVVTVANTTGLSIGIRL